MREKELIRKIMDFKLIYKHGTTDEPNGKIAGEDFIDELMKEWGEEVPILRAIKVSIQNETIVYNIIDDGIGELEILAESHKGKFAKYHSLTNHFQTERIESVLEFNPQFKDCKWIVLEKGHGRNFSIIITKDTVHYASRRHLLGTDYKKVTFGGFNEIGKDYQKLIKRIQGILKMSGDEGKYTFYGELIGPGVEVDKKIDYGVKQFRIFTLAIDDVYQTPESMIDLLGAVRCEDMLVNNEGVTETLKKALDYPNDLPTMMYKDPKKPNNLLIQEPGKHMREGNTIMPYDVSPHIGSEGQVFIIKSKNDKHSEINKPVKKELTEEEKARITLIDEIKTKFFNYITENRLSNVISKEDNVPEKKTIGVYVKLLISDAADDFLEDHKEYTEVEDIRRTLGKCGSRAASLVIDWIDKNKK